MNDEPLVVDALGRRCPIPVIELAKALPGVDVGAEVLVLSDDEASVVDIPVWCRMKGHDYLGAEPAAVGRAFRVRRSR